MTSLLVIAALALIYSALRRPSQRAPAGEQPAGTELIEGSDYRVLVVVARIKPRNPRGRKWDSGMSSMAAPDPYYEIWWRGNRVYRSQDVENVLVASWSNVALPELYKLLTDQKLSLETIKQGALITAHRKDRVRIRIRDKDPFRDDLIEEFDLPIDELRVGDQIRKGHRGLENMTLRVIPREVRQLEHLIR